MSRYRRVQPGDDLDISAAAWNALLDMLDQFELTPAGGTSNAPGGPPTNHRLVKNASGGIGKRFGVLGLDGPIVTETADADQFKTRVTWRGVVPQVTDHTTRFAILEDPIEAGTIGRGQVHGVCIARVNIQTDGDTRAGVVHNDAAKLTSGHGPVEILHPTSGVTGETLCVVRLNSPEPATLAKVTVVDPSGPKITATEVRRDGSTPANARVWDDGAAPNLPKLDPLYPLDLPLVNDVVEVFRGPNEAGDGVVWSCIARRQPVRAKVASVDPVARTVTATEIYPNGTTRSGGRSFGTIGVDSRVMPRQGDKITLGHGYNATGSAVWFIIGEGGGDVFARVTSSAGGSINWVEVSGQTFADVAGGLSGTAAIPNGGQEIADGTIVSVRAGENATYAVASIVRGVRGATNPLDHDIASGAFDPNDGVGPGPFDIDSQNTHQGVKATTLGGAYGAEELFGVVNFEETYNAEGQLEARLWRDAHRLITEAGTDASLPGHIKIEAPDTSSGNPTQAIQLMPPLETAATISFASGSGNTDITFDNSGRYRGGDVTIDLGTGLPVLEFDIVESVETTATELQQTVKRYRIPAELISTTVEVIDTIEDCDGGEQ